MGGRSALYSPSSPHCGEVIPNTNLETSRSAGWHSVFLRHDLSEGESGPIETLPTADQTLVVVLKGECDLSSLKGGRWRTVRRPTGSIGMTPGGERSRVRWTCRGERRAFESAHVYMPQVFFQEAQEHYRSSGASVPDTPLAGSALDDPAVSATVGAMVHAVHAGAPDLYAEIAAQWLAVHLLSTSAPWRISMQDGRRAGGISDPRFARVIDYLESGLDRTPTLDELAREAGISKFHFARAFRRRTGETPFGYLTRRRMERALELLVSSDLPIAAIAAECGYRHVGHFSTAFRRWHGCAPSQARAKRSRTGC